MKNEKNKESFEGILNSKPGGDAMCEISLC